MNTDNKIPLHPSYPRHLFALIVTTVFAIAVSLYCLNAGWFIVFQNLFYFPIIIACVYYLRKGFVFSVLLALFYLFLILAHTSNSTIIREAVIRVAIFIMVAGVVSFLSLKQKRSEEGHNHVRSWQEGINWILGMVLEPVPFDEKLKRITDGVVETFGADFCRIWIIGKGDLCSAGCMHAEILEEPHVCRYRDKCLHLKASSGRYTHIDGKAHRRVPFGAYKIGRIASGEEIRFLTNDVQGDPRVHDHEWAKSLGLAAFTGYRLRPTDGETLGVLALFTKFEISPDMDAILEGLSQAIALVIQKDIAERALAESKDRYRAVVEDQTEIISRFRKDGTLTFVNDVFCRFFAQKEEGILGTRWQPNSVPDDVPEIERKLATLSPSNPAMDTENRVYDGKGNVRWMQFVNRGFYDELGQLTEIQSVGRDITERRQEDEALQSEKKNLDVIFDSSPIGLLVLDEKTNIVRLNAAAEALVVGSASDMLHWQTGNALHCVHSFKDPRGCGYAPDCLLCPIRKSVESVIAGGAAVRGVELAAELIRNGKPQTVWLRVGAEYLTINDRPHAVVAMEDITGRKHIEDELLKAHNELEQKVLERTLELAKANEALTAQIQDRMKSEAALQESEQKYRGIFNNAIEGIYQATPEGRFLSANSSLAHMYGYDTPAALIADITDIGKQLYVDPRERERFKRLMDKRGSVEDYETQFYRKDGNIIWISFNARSVKDDENNILYYEGTIVEITERKRAEESLQKMALEWQNTFDAVGSAVWLLDENQRVVRANRATKDIFGKDPDELLGRFCYEVVHCTSHPITGCPGICTRQTRQRESMELNMGGRWLEVVTDPILDDNGRLSGIIHIVNDVTDRKKAEEAVKESEQLYRTLAEKSLVGTYVVQKGKHVFVSKNAAAIVGYRPTELIGKDASALIHPEDVTLARENGIKMLNGERTAPYEFRVIMKNNDVRWILEAVAPIVFDGNPAILGSAMDITEQKKSEEEHRMLERQLRQAQKMEAIGTLAGGIAHDFNNILGAISGFTELTLEHVPADSKAKKYLKRILTSSLRAADLVSQILAFSRQTEKALQPLRVSPIIKEVLKLIRATIPTSIEIRHNITAEPDMVMAEATCIHQVMMNLCTNANHAMRKNGGALSVSLTSESIVIGDMDHSGLKPGPYLKLTVSDTGEGIEPGVIDKIFDPFFTTKKLGEGTGLGLSVIHGIVKSLDGEITVESRLGQGTSFHVWLPMLSDSPREIMTEAEEKISINGSGRILFVDDEEALIEMTTDMLESLGYEVMATNDSIDALEIFRANPDRFDLVIADQTMPEMTGMAMAQEIMKIKPDTPIILCTGFSSTVDEETAKKAGIRDFVFKPIIKNKIADSIHHILRNTRS